VATTTDDDVRRRVLSSVLKPPDFQSSSSLVKVEIGAKSHRGTTRPDNEDHYLVMQLGRGLQTLATSLPKSDLPPRQFEERAYAMLVADGLGQKGSGSLAGRVALSTIANLAVHYGEWNLRIDPTTAAQVIEKGLFLYGSADQAVEARSAGIEALSEMATALTVAYSVGDHLFVGNVGHTRAYLFREGRLTRLTRDQTMASHLAETGRPVAMKQSAQDFHHVLTDVIGGAPGERPAVEIEHFRLINGDAVLLCTNGLTDAVTDNQICEVLSMRRRSREQCRMLVSLANQTCGQDNVTVILAQYEMP
jgi:serine/threonine protein phosphatase PrpC